jgi:hypothetical protein
MFGSLIFIGFAVYAGISLALYFFQDRLIYFPDKEIAATPEAVGIAFEDVEFETADGLTLRGWFVPVDASDRALLFFHGNAGNISHRLESLLTFHRLGLNTLIFDYRGYGGSEGKASEEGTYKDADAAWQYLTKVRGIEPRNVVIFGRSLGGAVGAWLAARVNCAGLIVESTFTSVPDLAAKTYPFLPVRLLARFRYDAKARIAEAHCPVLIVHSPDDELVPFEHGRALFEAANSPKTFLEMRGGHNEGFIVSGEDYDRGLEEFLGTLPSVPDESRVPSSSARLVAVSP